MWVLHAWARPAEGQAVPSPATDVPAQAAGAPARALLAAGGQVSNAVRRLAAATVTVRIASLSDDLAGEEPPAERNGQGPLAARAAGESSGAVAEIVVCTGVAVAERLVVTCAAAPAAARFRITLPDGGQAVAQPRVIDRYSGLTLLELEQASLPGLELAKELPPAGDAVLSASAAGIEPPAVSLGMVSAVGRRLRAVGLPPLLECDVRTTETSCGAGVVDIDGRLVGVMVGAPLAGGQAWSYAVPVSYVRRLIASCQPDVLVVLDRRRPSVGLSLGPGEVEGTVRVERVTAGGPAEQAGVKVGDVLLAADGRKIRSAYQAVDLIVQKEPGEPLQLVVLREGRELAIELVPAGGMARSILRADAAAELRGVRLGPQVAARAVAGGIRLGSGRVAELAVGPAETSSPGRVVADEITLLRKQLDAFEQVIERLQAELDRRERIQAETQALLEQLSQQVRELRAELERVRSAERADRPTEP